MTLAGVVLSAGVLAVDKSDSLRLKKLHDKPEHHAKEPEPQGPPLRYLVAARSEGRRAEASAPESDSGVSHSAGHGVVRAGGIPQIDARLAEDGDTSLTPTEAIASTQAPPPADLDQAADSAPGRFADSGLWFASSFGGPIGTPALVVPDAAANSAGSASSGAESRNDETASLTGGLLAPAITALVAAPLPEPSTWTMLLFGFGLAGLALRTRQRPA